MSKNKLAEALTGAGHASGPKDAAEIIRVIEQDYAVPEDVKTWGEDHPSVTRDGPRGTMYAWRAPLWGSREEDSMDKDEVHDCNDFADLDISSCLEVFFCSKCKETLQVGYVGIETQIAWLEDPQVRSRPGAEVELAWWRGYLKGLDEGIGEGMRLRDEGTRA